VALMVSGWLAGALICALLAVLALARAACSVSYKDVLGKTIEQSRRGRVTGLAGSVSAALVVGFAGLLIAGTLRNEAAVIAAIALAALAWCAAAVIFAGIDEAAGTPENITSSGGYLAILREDANLRRFILVRGLLVSTALAPPFFVLLATEGAGLNRLGAMLLAASLATFLGSYFWGRLADRDSRHAMLGAGCLGAAAMAAAILLHVAGKAGGIPVALFVLMLGWNGVKQARTIYLVDISDADLRARNTALANTAIGMILLLAGFLGGALSVLGPVAALAGFAVMALAGGLLALTLRPVGGAR
jgi:predicted MFS family arabinose efflux permease